MKPALYVLDLAVDHRPPVSFEVDAAAALNVIGPNGAGKSTLLRAVSGWAPRAGGGRVEAAGRIAHVLEGRRVFRDLTVVENLRAGAFTVKGRAAVAAQVAWALERFPMLAGRASTLAGRLSGGEQQLLAIATGLVSAPAVLLLDEPCVGLAPGAISLVAEVVAASGAAAVVAEQRPTLFPAAPALALRRALV